MGEGNRGAVAGNEPRRDASAGGRRSLNEVRRLEGEYEGSVLSVGEVDGD